MLTKDKAAGLGTAAAPRSNTLNYTLSEALASACAEVGIVYRDVAADGRWHKTDIDGDPRGRSDGRIKLFADGEGGIVCNWKGETLPFFVDDGRKLTEAERRDRERKRADAIRRAREGEARRHAEAREKALETWNKAPPGPGNHPYLVRKGVELHRLRLYRGDMVIGGIPMDGCLIALMCDAGRMVHSLHFIAADGTKRFLPDGRIKGCYFSIGRMRGAQTLCIAEGWATGATIHEATGHPVAVAFFTENLEPVARALRERFPDSRLISCADDDAATPGNPGLTKAKEATCTVGGRLAVPDFGENRPDGATDFNDLAVHRGLETVRDAIASAKAPAREELRPGNGASPAGVCGGGA